MATPLEIAVTNAVAEQLKLTKEMSELRQDLEASRHENAILLGKIKQLEVELQDSKISNDNNLQWASEVTSQLHSVGMFISDALNTARIRVHDHRQINGGQHDAIDTALKQVEKALLPTPEQKN